MSNVMNIKIAGLGGQGVLKATDILAEAAFEAGFDVKKSEVHGMSQRGGSVTSDVRYGDAVASPMIPEGETEILLILEMTQVDNNRGDMKSNGLMLTVAQLGELENPKTANIALLGRLSRLLEIPRPAWETAIKKFLPPKHHELNLRVFAEHADGK